MITFKRYCKATLNVFSNIKNLRMTKKIIYTIDQIQILLLDMYRVAKFKKNSQFLKLHILGSILSLKTV